MRGILCYILFLSCFGNVFSQTDSLSLEKEIRYDKSRVSPIEFEETLMDELKNDRGFDYGHRINSETWWAAFNRWINNLWNDLMNWLFGDIGSESVLAFIIEILPYLLLLFFIGLAVWLFVKLDPGGSALKSPAKPGVDLSLEEEIIHREDISKLIEKAVTEKNYRLAVRYYYLSILKKLREREIIDYQFQKTNAEYLSEIKDSFLNQEFRQITRIYDFIWYGDFRVTEAQFEKAKIQFEGMQRELENKKSA